METGEMFDASDVVFDTEGKSLPRDYCFHLAREVGRCLSWFESETGAGIHPLRSARAGDGALPLLLQRVGLGKHRALGFGIIVGHKSAAALG